jgi:hypothetical protein
VKRRSEGWNGGLGAGGRLRYRPLVLIAGRPVPRYGKWLPAGEPRSNLLALYDRPLGGLADRRDHGVIVGALMPGDDGCLGVDAFGQQDPGAIEQGVPGNAEQPDASELVENDGVPGRPRSAYDF